MTAKTRKLLNEKHALSNAGTADTDTEDTADAALTPIVEQDHARKPVQRDKRGRWLKGECGNPSGRPREALADLCRQIQKKHKLADVLGNIGAGKGEFKKADLNVRVRAIQLILAYGYGQPVPTQEGQSEYSEELRIAVVKRIVGVDPEDM